MDIDPLEPAGRDVVVELDPGISAEVARDELGEGFADNQDNGLIVVPLDQGFECPLDPFQSVLDGFTVRRADGQGVVLPLSEDPKIPPLDLIDLQPLPEPLVEISKLIDAARPQSDHLADRLGGPGDTLAGSAVERGEFHPLEFLGERDDKPGHLGPSAFTERDVEDPLDALLLVIGRCTGPDQDDLGHCLVNGPEPGSGRRPAGRLMGGCRVGHLRPVRPGPPRSCPGSGTRQSPPRTASPRPSRPGRRYRA